MNASVKYITSATESTDRCIICEASWDDSNIVGVRSCFESALAAPDYDSGRFAVAYNSTYTRAHELSQPPRLVIVEYFTSGSGTGGSGSAACSACWQLKGTFENLNGMKER